MNKMRKYHTLYYNPSNYVIYSIDVELASFKHQHCSLVAGVRAITPFGSVKKKVHFFAKN